MPSIVELLNDIRELKAINDRYRNFIEGVAFWDKRVSIIPSLLVKDLSKKAVEALAGTPEPYSQYEYRLQLKWTATGMVDAAAHIKRVFGPDAEYHAEIIMSLANKVRAVLDALESKDATNCGMGST
jgi:hypothetical protein